VVHRDADRLEQPGEIPGAGARTVYGPNGVHQVVTHRERLSRPPPNDLAREPARLALVAVVVKNPGQLGVVGLVEKRGGRTARRAHPHVEWSTRSESKSASGLIQLPGGHAQVDQDQVRLEGRHRL